LESVVVDPGFWRRRRVLITGHTGFKGSWLSLWLATLGAKLVGFSNGVPTRPALYEDANLAPDIAPVDGDVRDASALRAAVTTHRPEVVFHLAAQSLVRPSYEDPVRTYETNVLGTANLLEVSRDVVPVVIVVTSDKCYADSGDAIPHRESDALGGRDPYSSSKACAELVVEAYRASFGGDGTRIASVRAGNVIGGGDWAKDRLVPDLVRGVLAGEAVAIRNSGSVRPWQHVLNPLEGYLLLAERLWSDESYRGAWNFGPDAADEQSVEWVVARLAELWGEDIVTVPAAGPQPAELPALRLDSAKARARLGWRPRWDLEEGLRRVVEWAEAYRRRGDQRRMLLEQIDAHQAEAVPA
jgi:CDP-glucose 4,6-dehydratase